MEITKELLNTYRSKKDEIREIEWRLNNRWRDDNMIGNDVILDYSKGYPMPQSVVGFDQEKYERQQDKDIRRKLRLVEECEVMEEFVDSIQDSITRRIFFMSFLEKRKKSQREIARVVHLDRSRISRKIDEYLKNAQKAQKAHL